MSEPSSDARDLSQIGQRVSRELDRAKVALSGLGPAVAVYGGARVRNSDPCFSETLRLAMALSEAGLHAISGGGGAGIMEAANRGAKLGGRGKSGGLNIVLPPEQMSIAFQDVSLTFETFASRKIAFCAYSKAFVVMPGGVGTLDELFEVFTRLLTEKTPASPVILYGSQFWSGLLQWMRQVVVAQGLMSAQALDVRVHVVDSSDGVFTALAEAGVYQREAVAA